MADEASALERLLRRDRAVTLAGLAALCALAWLYVLAGAGMGVSAWDMTTLSLFPHKQSAMASMPSMAGMDAMDGMGAMDMGPLAWSAAKWAIITAMWWTMMIAMMIPSASPTILLYARAYRHGAASGPSAGARAPTGAFAAGYLLIWLAFSIAAAALHYALERAGLIAPMHMGSQSRWLSGAVLVAAGLFQLSPLKNACLAQCRAPVSFLTRAWRAGRIGALRMGVIHGVYCVGCCWVLMALLFIGGVMNLAWIAALAALVLAEKVLPGGVWIGRGAGVLLLAWGAATFVV